MFYIVVTWSSSLIKADYLIKPITTLPSISSSTSSDFKLSTHGLLISFYIIHMKSSMNCAIHRTYIAAVQP